MLSQKTQQLIYLASGILVVASALSYILFKSYAVYPFALGALGMIIIRIKNLNKTDNFRIRRLNNILAISTVLLVVTVYLMYIKHDAWIISLALSATMDLVVSFRMPKE